MALQNIFFALILSLALGASSDLAFAKSTETYILNPGELCTCASFRLCVATKKIDSTHCRVLHAANPQEQRELAEKLKAKKNASCGPNKRWHGGRCYDAAQWQQLKSAVSSESSWARTNCPGAAYGMTLSEPPCAICFHNNAKSPGCTSGTVVGTPAPGTGSSSGGGGAGVGTGSGSSSSAGTGAAAGSGSASGGGAAGGSLTTSRQRQNNAGAGSGTGATPPVGTGGPITHPVAPVDVTPSPGVGVFGQ